MLTMMNEWQLLSVVCFYRLTRWVKGMFNFLMVTSSTINFPKIHLQDHLVSTFFEVVAFERTFKGLISMLLLNAE